MNWLGLTAGVWRYLFDNFIHADVVKTLFLHDSTAFQFQSVSPTGFDQLLTQYRSQSVHILKNIN